MLDKDGLRRRLDDAYDLDPDDNGGVGKETYWRTMQQILGDAEQLGDTELLFEARLAYGWSLRGKTWTKDSREIFTEWIGLLRTCLTMWRAEPDRFIEDNVTAMWNQFFNIVDIFIRIYPEPAERVHRLIDELERQCLPSRSKVFTVLGRYRMEVEARRGNTAEVERLWQKFQLAEMPLGHVLPDGVAEVGATMWERLGQDERAIETLTPVLTGQITPREGHVYVDGLIMPYLRTGRTDEAVAAHQSTYARTGMKLEDIAAHLEFCARTGNEERGLDVLHRNLGRLQGTVTTVQQMWTAAAVALLCRRVTERGLDEEWVWSCEEEGCDCDAAPIRSYAELGAEHRWWALDFAMNLDEMDGTSFNVETILARLHAEPFTEQRLALPDAVSEPAHRARPRLSPHLAAATTEEIREELDRAREFDRRWERVVHLQRLMQNAFATGERDALLDVRFAHLDELLAYKPTAMRPDLFAAFTALVRLHDGDAGLLGGERLDRLWAAAPVVLERVLTRATVHAAQIRELIEMLGRHCRPDTHDLHHLRWYATELEVRCGDVDAARAGWAAFEALPSSCDDYATWANVLRLTDWWLDLGLGLHDDVLATMGPELSGKDEEARLIVPYLRAGNDAKAREIHERAFAGGSAEGLAAIADDPRAVAAHLEFCTRTGDLVRAKEIVSGTLDLLHVYYDDTEFTFDKLRTLATAVHACRLIAARGLDETWTWPEHDCCKAEEGWSYTRLATGYRTELTFFATRWQELTGSDFHTRRLDAIADAITDADADADTDAAIEPV
ncbi:MAG: hypothetical protein ACRDNL_20280 [Spirillospora sp.]